MTLTVARRSPLPRRPTHDDSRPLRGQSRGGRVYVPDLPGWYANTPGWHSAQRWLAVVDRWAHSRAGRRACERHHTDPDTVVAIAGRLAEYADHDSGRRCAPSQGTVAAAQRCARKTVQRAENALVHGGLLVLIHGTGLYTAAMYRQYRKLRRAGHQLALPRFCVRVRALTLPRSAVHHVPLPAEGRNLSVTGVSQWSPTARAARRAAARPKKPAPTRPGRPLEVQRFAARLTLRLPWLARKRHIGAVCDALTWAGVTPDRWTTETLLAQLADIGPIPDGSTSRSPLGWLHVALQRIDPEAETPVERQRRHRAELKTAQHEDTTPDEHQPAVPLDQSSAAQKIRAELARLALQRPQKMPPDIPASRPRSLETGPVS